MSNLAVVFEALGDPNRLQMTERLGGGESVNISELVSGLNMSRQGARKHLQVLVDAKLVTLETSGREVKAKLEKRMLEQATDYLSHLEVRWDNRLERLKKHVESDDYLSAWVQDESIMKPC